MAMPRKTSLTFHPATSNRWRDLEALFGPDRGADSGCWCMWWRVIRREWEEMGKAKRKAAFKIIVESGKVPGILAYDGKRAVGWCAVAPRETFPGLDRSPVAKAIDAAEVWSITCFYIDRAYRQQGVMAALIAAAARHVAKNGGRMVEAYPVEATREMQWADGFTGLASAFRAAGFEEVARRRPRRPVMRRKVRARRV
jgi:GNAT superfamily N-acetyltransferase